jgi:Leucine-rich repeat (LRR) protein
MTTPTDPDDKATNGVSQEEHCVSTTTTPPRNETVDTDVAAAETVATALAAPESHEESDRGDDEKEVNRNISSCTTVQEKPGKHMQDVSDHLVADMAAQMDENDATSLKTAASREARSEFQNLSQGSSRRRQLEQPAHGAIRVDYNSGARFRLTYAHHNDEDMKDDLEGQSVSASRDSLKLSSGTEPASDMTSGISHERGTAAVVDEAEMEEEFRRRMKANMVEATEMHNLEAGEADKKEDQEQATEWQEDEKARRRKRRSAILGGVGVTLIIVIVIILATTLSGKRNHDSRTPKISDYEYLEQLFLPLSGANMTVEGTPQHQALQWLSYDDPAILDIQSTSDLTLTQRYVMAVFFFATGGPTSWIDDLRFLSNYSVCEWPNIDGTEVGARTDNEVDCNENGEIVKIRIESNNLTGTIPKEIGVLTKLDIFTTGENEGVIGTIPPEMGELSLLTFLQFANDSLSGTLPDTLHKMKGLETFSVFKNNLQGTLPAKFLRETGFNLQILDVAQNWFNGTIPDAFIAQSRLRYVFMEGNSFEGPLPSSLYSQRSLKILTLSQNRLNGTIGPRIGAMKELRSLYLGNNALSGTLPTEMAQLDDLEQMELGSNRFIGLLPTVIGNMRKLKTIDVSNNAFSGSLPSEFGNLDNLVSLNVQSNPKISGSIPDSFSELDRLEQFMLSNTSITSGLNEIFCSKERLITKIQADCAVNGDAEPTVPCDCCTSCCKNGGEDCEIRVTSICEIKAGVLKSKRAREVIDCACSEDGTSLICGDTACETCTLDESHCASNSNYGYNFNSSNGEIMSFQNTIEYTTGPWSGTQLLFESVKDGPVCDVYVNGEKCRECASIVCASGFPGLKILCENVEGGSVFNR